MQEKVLQESLMMIPDCLRHLQVASEELKALIQEIDAELTESEEVKEAQRVLNAANALLAI